MEKLYGIYNEVLQEGLVSAVLSNLRNKKDKTYNRVRVEPVLIKSEVKIQFSYEYDDKVLHENLNKDEALDELKKLSYEKFRQINIFTEVRDIEVLISKKRKLRIIESEASKEQQDLSHNRSKNYILEDGRKHDFLIRLGIMNKDGKVLPSRYDKFRQINRFLELVEDSVDELDKTGEINIVDFGCGKSYLTFALYYYLVEILQREINVIGLDLKEDVIKQCNQIALDLNYEKLKFIQADIRDFSSEEDIDMVVSLHACDIATDAALVKSIAWNAKIILSVPCCQSEFYSKIEQEKLQPMLKHGIIKERLASLVTDSLRAEVLELLGYKVQLVEFIDMEHTHKNILIRAHKSSGYKKDNWKKYKQFKEFWNLQDLFIESELKKIGINIE